MKEHRSEEEMKVQLTTEIKYNIYYTSVLFTHPFPTIYYLIIHEKH